MPPTYNPAISSDKDWVRALCGDRDTANAKLQDEEILALLAEEANKYFAAARACEMIYARTGGLIEKQVGDLKLRFGGSAQDQWQLYINSLRAEGARRMQPKPRAFRVT